MQNKSKKWLLIGGALALTVALYFAPKKSLTPPSSSERETVSFETINTKAKASLKRQEAESIRSLEDALKKEPGNTVLIDTLAKRWDALQMPAVSAHYYEMKAEGGNDVKTWLDAAYRYYDAFRMAEDSAQRSMLVHKAIDSYQQVLKLDPDNENAKTDLGICYAEGTGEPMKGIMLLREVVERNPQHENAQFNLGVLSMQSGQYDKAIERFRKVLSINPQREEMLFAIGNAYLLKGDTANALSNFEQLKKQTSEPEIKMQAEAMINKIKTGN